MMWPSGGGRGGCFRNPCDVPEGLHQPSAVQARDGKPVRRDSRARLTLRLRECVFAQERSPRIGPKGVGGGRVSRQAITRGPANLPPCCLPALRSVRARPLLVLIDWTKETDHRFRVARNYSPLAVRPVRSLFD